MRIYKICNKKNVGKKHNLIQTLLISQPINRFYFMNGFDISLNVYCFTSLITNLGTF